VTGRVLVSGASGFIGARLLPLLAERGTPVTALSRRPPPDRLAKLAAWHQADLARGEALPAAALEGVEAVIQLAAIAHTDLADTPETRQRLTATNVEAPLALAEQAAAAGAARFLFVSSATVHGATSGAAPFTEASPLAPAGLYAESKVAAERGLRALADQGGIALTVVRPPLVYGPGVKGNLARLLAWAQAGRPLPSATLGNRRSLIGLDTLCHFLMAALDRPAAANETVLVADEGWISTGQLYSEICAALGKRARFLPLPYPLLAAALVPLGRGALLERLCGDVRLDCAKAARLLGQQAATPRADEIGRMAEHWRHGLAP
jgi:UDP-glucose 4-epimerase